MADNQSTNIAERQDKNIISHFNESPTAVFSSGETIVNGFDEPTGVFLIKKGFVKSYSTSDDGHANLLHIHTIGDIIPLPWSLDGINVTGLFYEAMDDVEVIKSSKDKLRITMGNNMWLTQEILNQTVNVIAVYTRRIQILEFRSARGRVIAELILLADRFGEPEGRKIIIRAPITHQDIADSINMIRETASRALEQLFSEGLVNQDDHLFVIDNMEKLKMALK